MNQFVLSFFFFAENTEPPETKNFFEQFYSHIYNVFYDNFIVVEANLRQKVQKRDKEELEMVLCILEVSMY